MPPVNVTYQVTTPTTVEEVKVVPVSADQGPYPLMPHTTVQSDLSPQPEVNDGYV